MRKQITKSYLEYLGVVDVSRDGKIFTKNGEIKPRPIGKTTNSRLAIDLYDSEKYKSVPKEQRNSSSGRITIKIHQAVYAWYNIEVPYGKEIHHIDGNPLNNSIENLEALTPEEHYAKHDKVFEKEEKCRLDIPREWYQQKLNEFLALEKKTASVYSMISEYRARLRYYDNHIEEATKLIEFKKDLMELKAWKQVFKENDNKKLWHQCCTIEKMVKEKGIEAQPVVKHALEVAHRYFGGI